MTKIIYRVVAAMLIAMAAGEIGSKDSKVGHTYENKAVDVKLFSL